MKKLLLTAATVAASLSAFSADQFYVIMKDGSVESYPTEKVDSISFNDPQIAKIMGFGDMMQEIAKLKEEIASLKAGAGVVSDSTTADFRFFVMNDKEAQITGLNKGTTNLVIPEKVYIGGKAYTVTSIGVSAFYGLDGIKTIELPNTIKSIGDQAFYDCTNLTSINIPEGVTRLGNGVFSGCENLASIDLPETLTKIGWNAFSQCTSLTSIVIPKGVTVIDDEMFYGCTGLTTVEIPSSVTSIEYYAFAYCTGLTTINIPSSVTKIGLNAFGSCENLDVVIDNTKDNVDVVNGAFDDCKSVKTKDGKDFFYVTTPEIYETKSKISVVEGGVYEVEVGGGAAQFTVTKTSGSYQEGNQVVVMKFNGFEEELTLSDNSFVLYYYDGRLMTADITVLPIGELQPKAIMYLESENSQANYTLASPTLNESLKNSGAIETKFRVVE